MTRLDWLALLGVAIAGAVGIVLAHVGWRWGLPELDRLIPIDEAIRFIATGALPEKGNLTSLGSYAPPGNAWLILPGVLVFDDPALYESVGSGLLYIGTLTGIFFLARASCGAACASFAAVLFALSSTGYFFADTLNAVGNPFFVVWSIYFARRWVEERDGGYLAAGLLVWGAGMYVFMVIAPLFFLFPFLWLVYRPPVSPGSLLAAAAVGGALWFPYLSFDMEHGFSNIISQLTVNMVVPRDYERTWYDPGLRQVLTDQLGGIDLAGFERNAPFESAADFFKQIGIVVAKKISVVGVFLTANFAVPFKNFAVKSVLMTGLSLASLFVIVVGVRDDARRFTPHGASGLLRRGRIWLSVAGLVSLALGVIFNELTVARFISKDGYLWPNEVSVIRQFQFILLVVGMALLWRRRLGRLLANWLNMTSRREGTERLREFLRFLSYAFLVPGLLLVLTADPSHSRRFVWLWPLQSIFLAVFTVRFLPMLGVGRGARTTLGLVLFFLLAWNPLANATTAWLRNGYAGPQNPLSEAVAFLAGQISGQGRSSASIGYNVPFSGYQISYNVIDSRYKVGAIADFLLRRRFGINNEDKYAEGVHPDDEFRIVRPPPSGKTMAFYIAPPREGFAPIAEFGDYTILKRVSPVKGREGRGRSRESVGDGASFTYRSSCNIPSMISLPSCEANRSANKDI